MAELTFEESLQALEKIVAQLEAGDLPLAQLLALYAEGQKLAQTCQTYLESAHLKVEALTEDGEIVEL